MKKIFLFLTALGILGACSSVRVSSDFDREANFAAYKKYAFTKEALELPVGDLNRKRILQAVTNELEAKGFTASDQPDVWIDLNVKTEQKQNATATTVSPYGTRYGYRWGMGVGFSTTNINIEQYVEGTLFVDMIDVSKKKTGVARTRCGHLVKAQEEKPVASAEELARKLSNPAASLISMPFQNNTDVG